MSDPRLLRLRVELFTAAQMLKGEDLLEFWTLIDELNDMREALAPKEGA